MSDFGIDLHIPKRHPLTKRAYGELPVLKFVELLINDAYKPENREPIVSRFSFDSSHKSDFDDLVVKTFAAVNSELGTEVLFNPNRIRKKFKYGSASEDDEFTKIQKVRANNSTLAQSKKRKIVDAILELRKESDKYLEEFYDYLFFVTKMVHFYEGKAEKNSHGEITDLSSKRLVDMMVEDLSSLKPGQLASIERLLYLNLKNHPNKTAARKVLKALKVHKRLSGDLGQALLLEYGDLRPRRQDRLLAIENLRKQSVRKIFTKEYLDAAKNQTQLVGQSGNVLSNHGLELEVITFNTEGDRVFDDSDLYFVNSVDARTYLEYENIDKDHELRTNKGGYILNDETMYNLYETIRSMEFSPDIALFATNHLHRDKASGKKHVFRDSIIYYRGEPESGRETWESADVPNSSTYRHHNKLDAASPRYELSRHFDQSQIYACLTDVTVREFNDWILEFKDQLTKSELEWLPNLPRVQFTNPMSQRVMAKMLAFAAKKKGREDLIPAILRAADENIIPRLADELLILTLKLVDRDRAMGLLQRAVADEKMLIGRKDSLYETIGEYMPDLAMELLKERPKFLPYEKLCKIAGALDGRYEQANLEGMGISPVPFVGRSLKTKKLEQSDFLYTVFQKGRFPKLERQAAAANMKGKVPLEKIREFDLDFTVLDKADKIKASKDERDEYILEKLKEAGLSERRAVKLAKRLNRKLSLTEIRSRKLNPMTFYEAGRMTAASAKIFSRLI